MTTRRSFFTRLAQFAAVVAIAPQICFRRNLEIIEVFNEGTPYECVVESITPETVLKSHVWNIEFYTDAEGMKWLKNNLK